MREPILVLDCGSSSIRSALFDADRRPLPRKALWSGEVEGIGSGQTLSRAGSRVPVAVEPSDEAWIAASYAVRLLF